MDAKAREYRITMFQSSMKALGVPFSDNGPDRDNLEFLVINAPALLAELILAIDATTSTRRYLWCNAFQSIVSTDGEPLYKAMEKYQLVFKNWIGVIAFTEEVYLPDDEDITWNETGLSCMAMCMSRLNPAKPLPTLLATMLVIRNEEFNGRNWAIRTGKEGGADTIAEMIDDVLPIVPELIKRRDTSLGMMQELLAGPSALLTGRL